MYVMIPAGDHQQAAVLQPHIECLHAKYFSSSITAYSLEPGVITSCFGNTGACGRQPEQADETCAQSKAQCLAGD